jgi:hypothetical protein
VWRMRTTAKKEAATVAAGRSSRQCGNGYKPVPASPACQA